MDSDALCVLEAVECVHKQRHTNCQLLFSLCGYERHVLTGKDANSASPQQSNKHTKICSHAVAFNSLIQTIPEKGQSQKIITQDRVFYIYLSTCVRTINFKYALISKTLIFFIYFH